MYFADFALAGLPAEDEALLELLWRFAATALRRAHAGGLCVALRRRFARRRALGALRWHMVRVAWWRDRARRQRARSVQSDCAVW